jgi:hypothetical protein
MLKKRIINVVVALALLAGVVGGMGIAADALGLPATSQVQACTSSSSSGGGC